MLLLIPLLVLLINSVYASNRPTKPFYTKSKNIIELSPATFDDYIFTSNHTTVVEFYAPWCKFCAEFKPEFTKSSKVASDFAQFAAVNCDEEKNKQLCAEQKVEGLPTIVIFRPPKVVNEQYERKHQYTNEIYQGERSVHKLVETLKGRVKNYTKKVPSDKLANFLKVGEKDKKRVLLLTEKRTISPMYKGLAVDFLNVLDFGYIQPNKQEIKDQIKDLIVNIEEIKTPMLLAIDDSGVTIHNGEMTKDEISDFLTAFGTPVEGKFSERGEIVRGIKKGKFKSFEHFFKIKKKKQQKVLKKDEL